MRNALMNLLPPDRARAARRNYFLRLAAVAALAFAVVIALHAVMLIPSYAYLAEDIRGKAARADGLAAALTPQEKAASSALATLSAAAVWIVVFLATRYASVASMFAGASLPLFAVLFDASWPVVAFTSGAALAIVVLHRGNIARLVRGQESKMKLRTTRRPRAASP